MKNSSKRVYIIKRFITGIKRMEMKRKRNRLRRIRMRKQLKQLDGKNVKEKALVRHRRKASKRETAKLNRTLRRGRY